MAYRNTQTSYGSIAKFFHWTIFFLVAILLIIGFSFEELAKPLRGPVINIHKLIGLAVLLLVLLRLSWLAMNPKPLLPFGTPAWERFAERLVHSLLYITLFAMPLSGWVMTTAGGRPPRFFAYIIPMPGIAINKTLSDQAFEVHQVTAWILLALISIHILAALKHHLISKNDVLKRMLPN